MSALAVAIVAIAALVGTAIMAAFARWRELKPQTAFLVAFATLSLVCLVAMPGFSTGDETHHFLRSYGIAHGAWVEDERNPDAENLPALTDAGLQLVGDYFPEGLLPYASTPPTFEDMTGESVGDITLADVARTWNTQTGNGVQFYGFANTALYSPVSYLPQALAIAAADLLTDSPWIMYYMARLAVVVAYGGLVYLAIRVIPRGKHLLAAIALCPRAIAEANSVGADALVVALCVLLVALVLKFRRDNERLRGGHIAALCAICAGIALCKIVYLPIVFLVILIPARCFRERGGLAIALAIALCACALNLGWLSISMGILHGVPMNDGVDSSAQIAFVLSDPIRFVQTMASTYATESARLAAGMFSGTYFYGTVKQEIPLVVVECALIILAWLFDRKGMTLGKAVRIVFAGMFVVIMVLTAASLYLQWTEVGSGVVDGLQGRYFLPVVILLLLAVQPDTPRLARLGSGWPNLAFYAAYLLVGATTLYTSLALSLA